MDRRDARQPSPPAPPRRRDFDPAEMALRGRIGAYRLHATHDPRETTRRGREAFLACFSREVDPEGVLPAAERARRALAARRAHFARLARQSARARRRRAMAGRPRSPAPLPPDATDDRPPGAT